MGKDGKVIKAARSNNTINVMPKIIELKDTERLVGARFDVNYNSAISIRLLFYNWNAKEEAE